MLTVLLAVLLLAGCPDPTGPQPEVLPQPPVITGVAAGYQSLTVTWGAVTGAASYEVYHNTADTTEGATQFGGNITTTSATITGLTNNELYYVWIRAKNSAGVSGYSETSSGTPTDIPAVTVASGNGQLTINWNSITWASAYEVYYASSDELPSTPSETPTGTSTTISSLSHDAV
jgi:hypothetical protein